MITGSHGRYQWLMDERFGIGHLVQRCPKILLHRYLIIVCFDSGPLHPNAEEQAAGWVFENELTYTPRLDSLNLLPYDNYDEWYVFTSPVRLDHCEVFINFGEFTLEDQHDFLAGIEPTWDCKSPEELTERRMQQQAQFWDQLERFGAESYIACGDRFFYVTANPDLFACATAAFESDE